MTESIHDDCGKNNIVSFMEKRKEDHNIPNILQLPNNILAEIFQKIPIKTLVQSRFVCKFWHRLLSDPQFNEQLFWRTTCLLLRPSRFKVHLVTLKNDSSSPYDVALKLSEDPIVRRTDRLHIVGSCNGLLCLYKLHSWKPPCGRLYISNPITGESLSLPTPPDECIISYPCGFGFSPMSGAYKLVRLRPQNKSRDEPQCWEVLVLTIGSGTWRSIGNFTYCLDYVLYGVCVSGFLHWIDWSRAVICAFDLEREVFHELPLPPSWDLEGKKNISRLDFSVLQGCLSVTVTVTVGSEKKMSSWVMKEHGVKESWSLELTIVDVVVGSPPHWVKFKDGLSAKFGDVPVLLKFRDGQVLLHIGWKLLAYASGKGFAGVEFDGIPIVSEAHVHNPSFVSPKYIIRG
ncbi:F-box protein At3g07870-like [Prunus avium]|uniref:F-box protein At3g07870-like n=1 Tax=Prunus avium TaxID=42229 RepID=A0A6P5RHG9_PRUAV|nr:F-box protein At3g07870-like [Prunus avium]